MPAPRRARSRKRDRVQGLTFQGRAEAFPKDELQGISPALGIAIAEAASEAAEYLGKNGGGEATFEVSRIQITVKPNPGPTSYSVTIVPSGG